MIYYYHLLIANTVQKEMISLTSIETSIPMAQLTSADTF
uniref:Uncharacterized protein n=1 Tax=Anguilla anguilla TaxID=7936 RepID=A0A0E9W5J2_ANGAN